MTKLKKIAWIGLCGRKRQTLLIIIAISLSLSFLVTIFNIQGSIEKTEESQRKDIYGEWQAAVCDIDDNILDNLQSNLIIEQYGMSTIYSVISDKNGGIEYGYLGTMDDAAIDLGNINLLEGNLPTNENEIAMEMSLLDSLGIPYTVGEEITIYLNEVDENTLESKSVETKFILSGVISNFTSLWKTNTKNLVSAIVSSDYANVSTNPISSNIFFTVKDKYINNINSLELLIYSHGYLIINDYTYFDLNPNYSSFEMKLSRTIVFIIIIFITSIFIIYNILSTTFQKRKKSLITLRIIGANKSHIISLIFYELMYLIMFSFPIGFILGTIFSYISYIILKSFNIVTMINLYSLDNYIVPLVITFISLIIGSIIPLLDLIKSSLKLMIDKKIKKKKMFKRKKINKRMIINHIHHPLLKSRVMLALLPILTFSVILISLSNCYIKYLAINAPSYYDSDYEFSSFFAYNTHPYNISAENLNKIKNTFGVEKVSAFRISKYYPIILEGKEENEYQDFTTEYIFSRYSDYKQIASVVHGIDIDSNAFTYYESQIQKGSIDKEKFMYGEEVILYLPIFTLSEDKEYSEHDFDFDEGIKGREIKENSLDVGDFIRILGDNGEVTVRIAGIIYTFQDEDIKSYIAKPYSMISSYALNDKLNLPDALETYQYIQVYANEQASYFRTDKELASIGSGLGFSNFRLDNEKLLKEATISLILALTLSLSIFGISCMLQLNSYYTNFEKVQRKIGILRAIGFTKKQYIKINVINTIFNNVFAITIGIVICISFFLIEENRWIIKQLDITIIIILFIIIIFYFLINLLLIYIPCKMLLKNEIANLIRN